MTMSLYHLCYNKIYQYQSVYSWVDVKHVASLFAFCLYYIPNIHILKPFLSQSISATITKTPKAEFFIKKGGLWKSQF